MSDLCLRVCVEEFSCRECVWWFVYVLTVLEHASIIVFECNERTIRWKKNINVEVR